ncbi:hypothetical protein [uncultured Pedobacter sp.]|uniref:hypothetical protein n=1 Tax=uncultured Pedobacter sp. TaxID=246139 RepID=UPI0025D638B1|nr:hypothetical protein [uncultured Pedobacter sp.]
MKKLTLSSFIFIGITSLFFSSCKKSNDTGISNNLTAKVERQKFPTLLNLSKDEADNLKKLFTNPDKKYDEILMYANKLAVGNSSRSASLKNVAKIMSANNNHATSDITYVDETESTENVNSSIWWEPNYADYEGMETEHSSSFFGYNGPDSWVSVPKFSVTYKTTLTLSGRNIITSVEVPIDYTLSFHNANPYFKINTNYTAKKPKLYITGVLGELHVEYETLSFQLFGGTPGDYLGNASVKIRENRAIVTTTDGSSKIEVNVAGLVVGGTASNGQTIQQVRNVQGYFDYNSDILFFGHNTGYQGTFGTYLQAMETAGGVDVMNLYKPVIGGTDHFTFTGINRN